MTNHLTRIAIYPVKSTAAINLEKSNVLQKGLALDREWIVVDLKGEALTAREYPKLVLIQSEICSTGVIISAPGMDTLQIPIHSQNELESEFTIFNKYKLSGVSVNEDINKWISKYLKVSCQLLTMTAATQRKMLIKDNAQLDDTVSYADSSPILLVSESSLENLNARMEIPISFKNFRPNIVISGTMAYEEDQWKEILIGECIFDVNKLCQRCVFTTLNQRTLEFDKNQEPLRTLSNYRKTKKGVSFGVYLIPRKIGNIKLGDEIKILK